MNKEKKIITDLYEPNANCRIVNTMCKYDKDNNGTTLDDWFKKEMKQLFKEAMREMLLAGEIRRGA